MRQLAAGLLVAAAVSTHAWSEFEDFHLAFLRPTDTNTLRQTLERLLYRLADPDNPRLQEDRGRIPRELLFYEDLVRPVLKPWAESEEAQARGAGELLWFLGDQEEIELVDRRWFTQTHPTPLLAPGLSRPDLAAALRAIRETLGLPEGEFRTDRLTFNRRMTKAYVALILGPGPLNCRTWGVMLHLRASGWQLVWSRPEEVQHPTLIRAVEP